jgi:predicted metal-dependent hydrolase
MLVYIFPTIIIILIIVIIWLNSGKIYSKLIDDNMVMEKSSIDEQFYLVQNRNDRSQIANKLCFIKKNFQKIIKYLKENIDDYPENRDDINVLLNRTKIINIQERPEHETEYTSYTVQKGKVLVFCMRSNFLHSIHDNNTIMYVAIHELAHVMSSGYGHGDEFVKNFKFLLNISTIINVYEPINYSKTPQEYCGMTIEEWLFD